MALPRYEGILAGRIRPAFKEAKEDGTLQELVETAKKHLENCSLCPRMCGKLRGEGKGYCGVGKGRVSSVHIHRGEEDVLVPSLTVFFTGCNMKCVYCQNYDISTHPEAGEALSPRELAAKIDSYARHVKNINFVGGEPVPSIPFILETLLYVEADLPVVFNSNMYMSEFGRRLVRPVTDVFLADIKYGNDKCAERLSEAFDYVENVTRSVFYATSKEIENRRDLLVRHLVLPNHNGCCSRPVIEWLAQSVPDCTLNVMAQYRPEHRASEYEEIRDGLSYKEFLKAYRFAESLGMDLI